MPSICARFWLALPSRALFACVLSRVQKGALHDLANHDNVAAVRGDATSGGDAKPQVPTVFLISSTTRTTVGKPAAAPAMRPGCYKTPADGRRSCLHHAHTPHASADTDQHPCVLSCGSPRGGSH